MKKLKDPARRWQDIWQYLTPHGPWLAVAALAIIISAGTTLALGQGLRILIDRGFADGNASLLLSALGFMAGIVVVMSAASFFRYFAVSWLGERLIADIRRDLFGRLLHLDMAFYESEKVGDLVSRVNADTTVLQSLIATSLPIILRNSLIFLGGGLLLVMTSPRLTGVVLAFIPVVLILVLIFGRKVRQLSKTSQQEVAQIGGFLEEHLNAISIIKSFVREPMVSSLFGGQVEKAFRAAVQRIRARALLSATVIFVVFSAITVMLWLGAQDVFSGRMTGGDLASFVFYAVIVAGAVAAISDVAGDLSRAAGAMERILELLSLTPEPSFDTLGAPLTDLKGGLGFKNVTFQYPAKPGVAAIEHLTLTIKPGERIAIVGPSGAGKTTLFKLLLALYRPQSGEIFLDKIPYADLTLSQIRSSFALVPQDTLIFAASALENIRFARPEASEEDVIAAAKAAHAHEFITALPEGYETFLGEKGVRLSGGQRQRIAIARALLKDAKILLLDEATNALDTESESLIQHALTTLMKDRTALVISHRLSTARYADRILVFNEGRLAEQGTHEELMANASGLYRKMIENEAQAK